MLDSRQLVQVAGDGIENTVRQVLEVDNGDVKATLHLGVGQGLIGAHLVRQGAGRDTGKFIDSQDYRLPM